MDKNDNKTIKVTYYFRKPFRDYFSIEELFGFIQKGLSTRIEFKNYYLKRHSKGFINRILSCFEVIHQQSDINHITGDIHFVALLLNKKITVLTIHDLEVLKRLKGLSHTLVKFIWFTMPAARVNRITVISDFTKQELLKIVRINPSKVCVIHNCISPALKPAEPPTNEKKKLFHIGTAHNKNLERLIPALEGIDVRLVILGHLRENQIELLHRFQIDYENYFNLSYPEVIQLYETCDAVSFISLYEGFGMPIIEANAIGRPVVSSKITSMPEIAGNAALLVDPENLIEINTAIRLVLFDEKTRSVLVRNGFENVERFRPEAIAKKYTDLYTELLINPKN